MKNRERTEELLRRTNSFILRLQAQQAESPDDFGTKLELASYLNLKKQFEAELESLNATAEPASTPRFEAIPVLEPERV